MTALATPHLPCTSALSALQHSRRLLPMSVALASPTWRIVRPDHNLAPSFPKKLAMEDSVLAKWMSLQTNFEAVTQQMRAINLPKITAPHVFCHHRAVVFFCILDHECIHLRDNLVLSEMAVLALRHFLLKNLLTTIHERILLPRSAYQITAVVVDAVTSTYSFRAAFAPSGIICCKYSMSCHVDWCKEDRAMP